MKMTFRWFGEQFDNITLKQIRQIPGCSGVVGVLNQFSAGEVWPADAIAAYKHYIESYGLELEVIESVNVHEDIKIGLPTRDKYIENYIETVKNLGKAGVRVICYNFMPVFDWLRTDLAYRLPDGSTAMYYDDKQLEGMTPLQIVEETARKSNGFTLPGWEPARLNELETVLQHYEDINEDRLRENYLYFLKAIMPVCEQFDVHMAVHPDDPAWDVFGIPRIIHSRTDIDKILALVNSPYNGITLCTGSFGSSPDNDVPAAIRHFCSMGRVPFAHVRNIRFLGYKCFTEASHLSEDGSFDMFEIMRAFYETGFNGYIRPDHGRTIWDEKGRPGYGLYDRALGITYLNGIWESLNKQDTHGLPSQTK